VNVGTAGACRSTARSTTAAMAAADVAARDGEATLEYQYSEQQLSAMNLRGNMPITLRKVFERECFEAGTPDATFKRTKGDAVQLILAMQRARLAREAGPSDDSMAAATVEDEAIAASQLRRAGSEAGGDSGSTGAAAASTPPRAPASARAAPSTPRPIARKPAPASSGAGGPAVGRAPGRAVPAARFRAAAVCKATPKVAQLLARELGVSFLDADGVWALRELVLLKAHGFEWDNVAKAAGAPNPYERYGEPTPGLRLPLFLGHAPVTTRRLVFCEQQLGITAKAGTHAKTRTYAVVDRILDRMAARRDGVDPLPGAAGPPGGAGQGGVGALSAAMPPGSEMKGPALKRALTAAGPDRIPDDASPDAPQTGDFVRLGSWNLRRFSVAGLSTRDMGYMVARLSRFDVVCLLELFSSSLGTAEEAVAGICSMLDDHVGRSGVWKFVISPATGGDDGGKASDGAAGGERSAIVWRADSTACTSLLPARGGPAAAAAGDRAPGGLCFAATAEERLATRYFARPPFYASFRTGGADYVVVAYHAVWDGRAGMRPRNDAARRLEFKNLAVGVDSLRHALQDKAAAELAAGNADAASMYKWAPVFVCGDFNAELLNADQQDLFDPLFHTGGQSVHNGLEATVIAGEAGRSHAFDMIWLFPSLATVEAVSWRQTTEDGDASPGTSDAESGGSPAAADEMPEDYDSAKMLVLTGHGVEDVMGVVRANLVERSDSVAALGGSSRARIEPRPEAVEAINKAFSALGLPFASHATHRPDIQANALLVLARTLVSSSLSDHVPVWIEFSPVLALVSDGGALSDDDGVGADAWPVGSSCAGTETYSQPQCFVLPSTRLDRSAAAGWSSHDTERPAISSEMYS